MSLQIVRDDGTLVIRMPAPRALAQALIAASWIPFVIIAGIVLYVASGTFASLSTHGATGVASGVFFLVFALALLIGALVGLVGSFYGFLGSEVARVTDGRLILERVLFGAKQRQVYDDVTELRRARHAEENRRWAAPPGKLRFETHGHPQAFGAGLTDDEAEEVLAALREALA